MNNSQRKPRVFLSHSKKDIDFIRELANDLRMCQCDIWIDEVEIRHGKPWLDEIFSTGLPSCEVVLCYCSEYSLQSKVFSKELDARLIERLANDRVSLLLYVANDNVRNQLRLDLQTLQIPVLNVENYNAMLPRVVSQIWQCYMEWALPQAIQQEHTKRLELELKVRDLEAANSISFFSKSEQSEFTSIWDYLNKEVIVNIILTDSKHYKIDYHSGGSWVLNCGNLFRLAIADQKYQLSLYPIYEAIEEELIAEFKHSPSKFELPLDYENDFLQFGFIRRERIEVVKNDPVQAILGNRVALDFTEKFDRFKYWLTTTYGVIHTSARILVKSDT